MPAKTRRSHRKSRNGCIECKHRHIRCDEHRPTCANCKAAERTCSFLTAQAGKQKQKIGPQNRKNQKKHPQLENDTSQELAASGSSTVRGIEIAAEVHSEQSTALLRQQENDTDFDDAQDRESSHSLLDRYRLPSSRDVGAKLHQIPSPASPIQPNDIKTPPSGCLPGLSTIPDSAPKAIFTPQHMVLLYHAGTVPNFALPNRNVVDIAIRHAITSPYLIDEILAFTAFHLASLYPESAVYLRHLATELQTRALTSFTRVTELVPHDDKATAVPRFLFSAILGRHALVDALTYCGSDFHFFIDRFVECINLNRGIIAATPPAWEYLRQTEVRPFLSVVNEAMQKITSPGSECDPISRLMDDSDLNEKSIEACRQAIEILQLSFDICQNLQEEDYPQAVSVFSVKVGAGFIDVLRKHRPEALVILAYYGVLLLRCRSLRSFADAGASVISTIAHRLGSYWQDALTWPLYVLQTERHSETPNPVSGPELQTIPLRTAT